MHNFQRNAHGQRVENKISQQPKPKSALREGDVNLSSGAEARAGSGPGPHEVHMLHGKPPFAWLPVFLIPLSFQPLLTLGTMQLCAETVPFVMAWERKKGEAGWGVCVCESLSSHGQAGCSGSLGLHKGTQGAWPEPTPGGWSASCRVPCSEPHS